MSPLRPADEVARGDRHAEPSMPHCSLCDEYGHYPSQHGHYPSLDHPTPFPEGLIAAQWRQGRRVGRCIHAMVGDEPSEEDILIGVFDTPELATHIVALHNEIRLIGLDADREPQPSDGPDYHADHQAWTERQLDPWGRSRENADYGQEPPEGSTRRSSSGRMRMITLKRRGRVGWSLTLATKRYHRTLWVDRPRLTKLSLDPPKGCIGNPPESGSTLLRYDGSQTDGS